MFEQLAEAINDAFGRWDLAHLHEFTLADGTAIGLADPDWDDGREVVDARRTKLSRLGLGEKFAYLFDFGDNWAHVCTVGSERADLAECYGIVPPRPAAIFGCGESPRPVRPAMARRRRFQPTPAEPEAQRPPGDPPSVASAQ